MLEGKNIKFQYSLNNIAKTVTIKVYDEQSLETIIDRNFRNIKNKYKTFRIIKDNKEISLNKKDKIKNFNLKDGDLILISFEAEIEDINHIQNMSSEDLMEQAPDITEPEPRKNKIIILGIVSIILIALTIFLVLYFKYLKNNNGNNNNYNYIRIPTENNGSNGTEVMEETDVSETLIKDNQIKELKYEEEVFAVKKEYPSNRLFIFREEQVTEMNIEGEKINENDSYHNISQLSDFIFITRDSFTEKNNETLVKKKWYRGYIAIFNLIIPNITHDNHLIYDESINNYLNVNKKKLTSRDIYLMNNKSNYCFALIEFYHNGEIKNIYLPEGFPLEHYSYIKENIKLLIPKISQNLYIDSIEKKLNEITEINNDNENNDEDLYESDLTDFIDNNDDEEEKEEEENNLRNLNMVKKPKNIYLKRRFSDGDNNNSISNYSNSNNLNSSGVSYEYEDFLTKPISKTINYEFREVNVINDLSYESSSDFFTESFTEDYTDINILNNNNLYSNLTDVLLKV